MFTRRSLCHWQQTRILSMRSRAHLSSSSSTSHVSSRNPSEPNAPTDALGLPLSPPWSVHALINSYPSPKLPNATLTRLHDLAALVPPAEGTPEFEQLKVEMEDLVRLVEAVRMAPAETTVPEGEDEGPPDGRVWAQGRGIAMENSGAKQDEPAEAPPAGRELLQHAQRTKNGFYLVDSARTKT